MANQKFSDFSNQPPGAGTYLVGYDGVTNVRTLASNIGGGSLDNYDVPKGYSPYPFTQYVGTTSGTSLGANDQLFFSEPMKFQVYQDTEINKARLNIVASYAGEVYKAGLYKYDFDNHKMVLVTGAEWDFPADATGAVTISLGAPLTISAGTYYMGLIQTIGFPPSGSQIYNITNVTNSSYMPTIRWWDNNISPVGAAGRITRMRYTTPTAPVSSMPTEILWADMTLDVMANYPILATLVF
jgi:hypothetical protein